LYDREILKDKGRKNLEDALSKILLLRITVQLFYRDEIEHVHHPLLQVDLLEREEIASVYILTEDDVQKIIEIFQTLIPLNKAINQFYNKNGDFSLFSKNNFKANNLFDEARASAATGHIGNALVLFKYLLALTPDNVEVLKNFANELFHQGEKEKSLMLIEHAIERIQKSASINKLILKELLLEAASKAIVLELNDKFNLYLNQFLSDVTTGNNEYQYIELYIKAYTLKGDWLLRKKYLNSAEDYYQKALALSLKPEYANYRLVINSQSGMDEKIKYNRYIQKRPHFDKFYPIKGRVLRKLGELYCLQEHYRKSIDMYEQCLQAFDYRENACSDLHKVITAILMDAARVCILAKDFDKANSYFQFAFNANKALHQHEAENSLVKVIVEYALFNLEQNYVVENGVIFVKVLADYVNDYGDSLFINNLYSNLFFVDSGVEQDEIEQEIQKKKSKENAAMIINLLRFCNEFMDRNEIADKIKLFRYTSMLLFATLKQSGIAPVQLTELQLIYLSLLAQGVHFYQHEQSQDAKIQWNDILRDYFDYFEKNHKNFTAQDQAAFKRFKGIKLIIDGEKDEGKALMHAALTMFKSENADISIIQRVTNELDYLNSADKKPSCSIC